MIDRDSELRSRIALALRNAREGGYAADIDGMTDEELCDDLTDFDACVAEMAPRSPDGTPDFDRLRTWMLPHVAELRKKRTEE